MLPRVARQCNALGASHLSSPRLQSRAWCLPLRAFYHRTAPLASEQDVQASTRKAIIVPKSHTITLDALVQHIAPLQKHHYSNFRFAVFFVTPTYASWLREDQTFLRKAVNRLFGGLTQEDSSTQIKALVAVVNKLPTPSYINSTTIKRNGVEYEMLNPGQAISASDSGHEGIAYTVLRASEFNSSMKRTDRDESGTIEFTVMEGTNKGKKYRDIIRLPLANTMFQSGTGTTMYYTTWKQSKSGQGFDQFVATEDLISCNLRLHEPGSPRTPSTLRVPLVPMTMPRLVGPSMGNIIRTVSDETGKSMTASKELEEAVPQYFTSRNEAPRPVSIWALLIPDGMANSILAKTTTLLAPEPTSATKELWAELWRRGSATTNDIVSSALKKGARLHRVTSGGGGWGKKAGMLSLDPSTISNEPVSSEQGNELNELSFAFDQVVRENDSIQFFVSPTTPVSDLDNTNETPKELSEGKTFWSHEFGVVPSTMDAMDQDYLEKKQESSEKALVFKNTFGALSEEGMATKRQFLDDNGQPVSVEGSKIDVPYSRYCVMENDNTADVCTSSEK